MKIHVFNKVLRVLGLRRWLLEHSVVRLNRSDESIILRLLLCAKIPNALPCNLPASILIQHGMLLNYPSGRSPTDVPTGIPNHPHRAIPAVIVSNSLIVLQLLLLLLSASTSLMLLIVLLLLLIEHYAVMHTNYLRLLQWMNGILMIILANVVSRCGTIVIV